MLMIFFWNARTIIDYGEKIVMSFNADFDIKAFLGGVSIAMFASFWGLFCTVSNSSFNLKNARRSLEKAKNVFYTFLQTELLPVLNQSVSSSIYTLHTNLVKFNDNFTINLNKLSGMLNKNHPIGCLRKLIDQ